jgi:hypothetical protein
MSKRLVFLALVSAVLASCGVKSDVERTNPRIMLLPENQKDPSKPPIALGEPGTPPPYTTGP